MFASTSFRWTFVEWRFFSLITAASVLLTISTFVLGLMCRLNFGKGLSRYRTFPRSLMVAQAMLTLFYSCFGSQSAGAAVGR